MAESRNARVARLANLFGVLAEKEAKLDGVLTVLANAQIKTLHQLEEFVLDTDRRFQGAAHCFQQTGHLFQETDRLFQESDRRAREIDERIDKLLNDIRQLVRRKRP